MKIRKDIEFIDQHDELGMWGKHGGTFCGESLKKPIDSFTAYICEGFKCLPPINSFEELLKEFL